MLTAGRAERVRVRRYTFQMKFTGTDTYVADEGLKLAVNAAVTLERPLLIKGEPGTGKTLLAEEVARALGKPLYQWHIKSTTKAQQGLYEYDAVSRLRDSQLGQERVHDIANYIVKGVLWQAFECEQQAVVLVDEIDKADIEFPNDLLRELDRMEFYVYETQQTIRARHRPIIFITSTTRRSCPTRSCGAASSTTSASPTRRRCRQSSTCTSRRSRSGCCKPRWRCSSRSARCRG